MQAQFGQGHHHCSGSSPAISSASTSDEEATNRLQYVAYEKSTPAGVVQQLRIYFHQAEELLFVMTARRAAGGLAKHCGDADEAAEVMPWPPPGYCMAQLRHTQHFMLAVAPTVHRILAQQPNYDAASLYSSGDFAILQSMLQDYRRNFSFATCAVRAVLLPPRHRHFVETALRQQYRAGSPPPRGHLYSLLFSRDALVAAVGPPESYSGEADSAAAFGPDRCLCGSLHVDDVLLLMHYIRATLQRQAGEAWVPLCLPRFNRSGYLWCHAVNLSRRMREQQGLASHRSPWPLASTEWDLLLVHLSASQDDFSALSRCSSGVVASFCDVAAGGEHFYSSLEESIYASAIAPASAAWMPSRAKGSGRPSGDEDSEGGGSALLWNAMVLGELISASEPTAAVASNRPIRCLFDSPIPSLIRELCSSSSERIGEGGKEEEEEDHDGCEAFCNLVCFYHKKLHTIPHAASSLPLIIVDHSTAVSLVLLRSTAAVLSLLAESFVSTAKPLDYPAWIKKDFRCLDRLPEGSEGCSNFMETVQRLGAVELMTAFAPGTPQPVMLYWCSRLLYLAAISSTHFGLREIVGRAPTSTIA